jgi:hypothetical protein
MKSDFIYRFYMRAKVMVLGGLLGVNGNGALA